MMHEPKSEVEIGGTKVKTLRALGGRRGDDVVRHYSADGTIYGYREGDEHVVVSDGREPADRWTKRVPAERTAVTPGEHLWSIPDNWTQRVSIDGNGAARYAIYHIPESDVDVEVSVPNKNHLVDAWWSVRSVGEMSFSYADSCDWDALDKAIERRGDEWDDDVREAIEELARRGEFFERELDEAVAETAEESLFARRDTANLQSWTTDPWGDIFDSDGWLLGQFLDIDGDVLDGVREVLGFEGVIPSYPEVRVGVDDSGTLPEGFGIEALIEAGCSPPEAVDYFFTEIRGQSQSDWARTRNRGQPAVSENVTAAKREVEN